MSVCVVLVWFGLVSLCRFRLLGCTTRSLGFAANNLLISFFLSFVLFLSAVALTASHASTAPPSHQHGPPFPTVCSKVVCVLCMWCVLFVRLGHLDTPPILTHLCLSMCVRVCDLGLFANTNRRHLPVLQLLGRASQPGRAPLLCAILQA